MQKEIKRMDKIIILWHTGWKVFRGLYRRLFLKHAKGFLLIGRHVQITHGKHITCGKNVKFEDYTKYMDYVRMDSILATM